MRFDPSRLCFSSGRRFSHSAARGHIGDEPGGLRWDPGKVQGVPPMAWSVEPGIMGAMQTEQRVLTRRKDGRLIAGVAGGLADYTATPVTWWRWGFALVALLGCLGFLVLAPVVIGDGDSFAGFGCLVVLLAGGIAEWIYIAMWILVPRVDLPRPASFSERLETRPG